MRFEEIEAPIGQKFSSGSFEFHARPSFHCSRLPSSAISRHAIMEPEFSSLRYREQPFPLTSPIRFLPSYDSIFLKIEKK